MSTAQRRASDYIAPKEPAELILPVEHVDAGTLEVGIDHDLSTLIDQANGEVVGVGQAQSDVADLTNISTSLERTGMLIMESLEAGTGLNAQTLMAIEYGVQDQLSRASMDLVLCPSLEDNTVTDLEKTCVSLENLQESLKKIEVGVSNAVVKMGRHLRDFFSNSEKVQEKMLDKLKKLRAQWLAIETAGEPQTLSGVPSVVFGLYYGDPNFSRADQLYISTLKALGNFARTYSTTGVKELEARLKAFSTVKDGVPTITPEDVVQWMNEETKRREVLLQLGYGQPTGGTHYDEYIVETSGILPGGAQLESTRLDLSGSKDDAEIGGAIIASLGDCTLDLTKASKMGKIPTGIPAATKEQALAILDAAIEATTNYHALVSAYRKVGDSFDDTLHTFEKIADSFSEIRSAELDPGRLSTLDGIIKGKNVATKVVQLASIGKGLMVLNDLKLLGLPAGARALVFINAAGKASNAWILPAMIGGMAMGGLLARFIKDPKGINVEDPNAALLYILRALKEYAIWMPVYATNSGQTTAQYMSKFVPTLIDYLSMSAKVALKPQAEK